MPCDRDFTKWTSDKFISILPRIWWKWQIGSIALYGANLQGHYNAMLSSMTAFGMPISNIEFDSGIETFFWI